MDLPFSDFELAFIIIAFFIISLFTLMSVCFQPGAPPPDHVAECEASPRKPSKNRVITKAAIRIP